MPIQSVSSPPDLKLWDPDKEGAKPFYFEPVGEIKRVRTLSVSGTPVVITPQERRGETHLASKQPYTRETYLPSLQRLEAWAENQGLDTKHLKTADLAASHRSEMARSQPNETAHVSSK